MSDEEDAKSDLEEQEEAAQAKVAELEDDPPQDLQDWPDGDAKYKTFGGPDSETGYDDGPTANLGDSDVRYMEDGSVRVDGEEVDNPDDYKGDPIPGGPTDPDAERLAGDKVGPGEDADTDGDAEGDNSSD